VKAGVGRISRYEKELDKFKEREKANTKGQSECERDCRVMTEGTTRLDHINHSKNL
jgi:hypothetical protein